MYVPSHMQERVEPDPSAPLAHRRVDKHRQDQPEEAHHHQRADRLAVCQPRQGQERHQDHQARRTLCTARRAYIEQSIVRNAVEGGGG